MQSVANLIKIINLAKFQIFKTIRLSSRISKRNQTTSLLSSISKSKITVIKFSRLSDFVLLNKILNLQISRFMLKTLPKIWTSQIKNFKKDRKELADILKIHKNLLSWIFIFLLFWNTYQDNALPMDILFIATKLVVLTEIFLKKLMLSKLVRVLRISKPI